MRPLDTFFKDMAKLHIALTYDDVRLKTGRATAEIMPEDVDISSKFSRNVPVKIPIISSPMDTVTEARMAIAIAMEGGLGIIHRNLDPTRQATAVRKVKSAINGVVENPICVRSTDTIEAVLRMRDLENLHFSNFPVLDDQGRVVGLLMRDDFKRCDNITDKVSRWMKAAIATAPETTDLNQAYALMQDNRQNFLPIISQETGTIIGMYTITDLKRIRSGKSAANVDERGQLLVGAAIGVGDNALLRAHLLKDARVDVLVIDTAHGDSQPVFDTLKQLKDTMGDIDIVVGNVSEADSTKRLIKAGADGLRYGQGPGSICTTRIIAGVGCPQVTCIYNCSQAAHNKSVHDDNQAKGCADGGVKQSGDVTIALATGADTVMLGNMLAGTDEAPGEKFFYHGIEWKGYRGMGSIGAMTDGSGDRYGQEHLTEDLMIPEGIEGKVPATGPLSKMLHQIIGGLRQGMGYVGATNIKHLQDIAEFHRISVAGTIESHPHHVIIDKDAPNYKQGV